MWLYPRKHQSEPSYMALQRVTLGEQCWAGPALQTIAMPSANWRDTETDQPISPVASLVRACVPHSRMLNTLETSFMHEESKRTQARDSICSSTPCLVPEASPHSLPWHTKTLSHSPRCAEVTQETPHFTLDQDCPLSSPQIKN